MKVEIETKYSVEKDNGLVAKAYYSNCLIYLMALSVTESV
jgi:hypothetical protein